MSDWTIESGIPIPRKNSGGRQNWSGFTRTLRSMEVGQSVCVSNANRGSVTGAVSTCTRNHGMEFVTRSADDGIRVWRVA